MENQGVIVIISSSLEIFRGQNSKDSKNYILIIIKFLCFAKRKYPI